MRAFFRSAWDWWLTRGKCQATALGTAGGSLGWYHYKTHCNKPRHWGSLHQSRYGMWDGGASSMRPPIEQDDPSAWARPESGQRTVSDDGS